MWVGASPLRHKHRLRSLSLLPSAVVPGRFTLRVNVKCQNVFLFCFFMRAGSLTGWCTCLAEGAAAQTGMRRSEYLMGAECGCRLA